MLDQTITCKWCSAIGSRTTMVKDKWRLAKNAPFCYCCSNPDCVKKDEEKKVKKK